MMGNFFSKVLIVTFFTISLCACVNKSQVEHSWYSTAISDAAVIETDEIIPLPIISSDEVKLVTWTKYPASYVAGAEVPLKWGDVWVTLDGEVKKRCVKFPSKALEADIGKLLGLPPTEVKDRYFVTFSARKPDIFRPCINPDVSSDTCSLAGDAHVTPEHLKWIVDQMSRSYITGGYPWTRLGYSYNWKRGENEIGPAEFVVRKDSKVTVIDVSASKDYCREHQKN